MNKLELNIAPTTKLTVTVLGVTSTDVVFSGETGETQSVKLAQYPELADAKAGDIVNLKEVDGQYFIDAIEELKVGESSINSSARSCRTVISDDMRNDV